MTDTQYGTPNDETQESVGSIIAGIVALNAGREGVVGYHTPEGKLLCRACAEKRAAAEGLDLDAECQAYHERRMLVEGYVLFGEGGVMEDHPGTAQGDDRYTCGWATFRQYQADWSAYESAEDEEHEEDEEGEVRAIEDYDYPVCDICSEYIGLSSDETP